MLRNFIIHSLVILEWNAAINSCLSLVITLVWNTQNLYNPQSLITLEWNAAQNCYKP
jgi:hypothetical protein